MKIEPEGVKCLVKPEVVEEKTSGGIYLAPVGREMEQRAVTKGTVAAIGPAAQMEFNEEPLKEGDRVIYARYAGFSVKDEDTNTDYIIMNDVDILARVS